MCTLPYGVAGGVRRVRVIPSGAYFGELALIKNQPRAATITAVTDCKCLVMDRAAFTRLLGPMNDILARQADVYHKCVGVVLGAMAHAVTLVVFVAQV